MKNLAHGVNAAVSELVWYLVLQGVFLLVFAVLALFYPYFLVIIVAFLLICLAVISLYFGFKVWAVQRRVKKFLDTL